MHYFIILSELLKDNFQTKKYHLFLTLRYEFSVQNYFEINFV